MVDKFEVVAMFMFVSMLIDGKRSIIDMARFIRMQGMPMDDKIIGFLVRFFKDLKEARLVTFEKSSKASACNPTLR